MQIQFTGLALEPLESLLAESSVIMLHPLVDVLRAKFEHAVDQTGKFVGHRGDGFGRAKAGSEAPIVGAQGTLTVPQILRGQAQGVGGAVDDRTGPRASTLPPLIWLSGHKPSQEAKCFSVFHRLMSRPISEMRV